MNSCSRCKDVPGSLWIALLALLLFFLHYAFGFVTGGGTGVFIKAMLVAVLIAGLYTQQVWSFIMTIILYLLFVLAGLQAWDYSRLMWLFNAIAGGFVLVPVIINKPWLMPEESFEI